MLNKENIMDIIKSHKDEINKISNELIKAEWGLEQWQTTDTGE